MSAMPTILILEDEPFIMLDLEMAAEDHSCKPLTSFNCDAALAIIAEADAQEGGIDVAVLDVSLQDGETCLPVARELERRGVPFLLHTGDLVGDDGTVMGIDAPVLAKPTSASAVVGAALALIDNPNRADRRFAAE